MKQYSISLAASQDLEEIIDYFASRNAEAGERFIQKFDQKCRNLTNFPNMGRSYEQFASSLRGVPLNGYIIFYSVSEENVVIVRVVSAYRDLETVFRDEG